MLSARILKIILDFWICIPNSHIWRHMNNTTQHNLIYLNLYFSQKYRDYTIIFIKEQGQVPGMCNGPSMIKKSNNKKVSVGIFHLFLIDLQYNSLVVHLIFQWGLVMFLFSTSQIRSSHQSVIRDTTLSYDSIIFMVTQKRIKENHVPQLSKYWNHSQLEFLMVVELWRSIWQTLI